MKHSFLQKGRRGKYKRKIRILRSIDRDRFQSREIPLTYLQSSSLSFSLETLDSIISLFFGARRPSPPPFLMPVVLDSWRNKKERARSLDNITRGIRGRQNDGVASHADELFCSQNNQSSRQCFRPARFSLSAQLSATYFSPSGFPISAIRNIPRKLERSCFLLLCQGS